MTIWFVIDTTTGPPNLVEVFRTAYLETDIRGLDNPDDPERLVMIEGRDGKFMSGSSRITTAQADSLVVEHTPSVEVFTEFPPLSKWQPKIPV